MAITETTTPMILNYSGIYVEGRRWFDRLNGNTYHTAQISLLGEKAQTLRTLTVPFSYGYGEQYVESARELLVKEGLLPELKYENGNRLTLQRTCEHLGLEFSHSVSDVGKSSLHREND